MKKIFLAAITTMSLFAGMGDILRSQIMFENLEVQKEKTVAWDMNAFIGYDKNKLYLFSEGEKSAWQGSLVYSRAISPFWDLQAGIEVIHDKKSLSFGEIALYGLAPYWIETRAKLLFGHGGIGIDADFSYEMLFSQKLILESSLASRWMSKSYPQVGIGKGLNYIEAGLRLRYEIKREFAPYIGVNYKRNFGKTKKIEGRKSETSLVLGVRFWF